MALNSQMNIQVRVIARQAQAQLAMVDKQIRTIEKTQTTAAKSAAAMGRIGAGSMIRWGSQTQWAGRQLIYNFTLPLALAAGATTKWALENQKAMTRVRKVYGDTSMSAKQMRSETVALAKGFRVLSDTFGVNEAATINIGADWAAAGASGIALAKATKLTMQTMVLGELDAATATKSLIAIQAQYGFNTKQLSKTIDVLNMVENQTGTSMKDLIDVMSRTAGSARTAGIDVRHLAAYTAALVPAAGTASQAGNALKTVFSRILAPTKQASDLLKMMGINTHGAAWEATAAGGRLEVLAHKFEKLSSAQKAQATTVLAGRYQLNRFDTIMRALITHQSYYKKALDSTSSASKNFAQKQKELNMVLNSAPQQFQQIKVQLQNMGTQIITPLIPMFLALAQGIRNLIENFQNLDPRWQKFIIFGLAALAFMGPILRQVGALMTLIGYLGRILYAPIKLLHMFAVALWAVGKAAMGAARLLMLGYTKAVPYVTAAVGGVLKVVRWYVVSVLRLLLATAMPIVVGLRAPFMAALAGIRTALVLIATTVYASLARTTIAISRFGMRATFTALMAPFVAFGREVLVLWSLIVQKLGIVMLAGFRRIASIVAVAATPIMTAIRFIFTDVVLFAGLAMTKASLLLKSGFTAMVALSVRFAGAMKFIFANLGLFIGLTFTKLRLFVVRVWTGMMQILLVSSIRLQFGVMRIFSMLATGVMSILAFLGAGIRLMFTRAIMFIASGRLFSILESSVMVFTRGLLAILVEAGGAILGALTSPWVLAIVALIGLFFAFKSKIAQAWNNIVQFFQSGANGAIGAFADVAKFFHDMIADIIKAFYALPTNVQNAMKAVVRVVVAAAKQVYEWFSYLNPFAHHSPSLVENVTGGMNIVRDQHTKTHKTVQQHTKKIADHHSQMTSTMVNNNKSLNNNSSSTTNTAAPAIAQQGKIASATDSAINKAIADMKLFKQAAKGLIPSEWGQEIKDIKKSLPSVLPMFMNMLGDLKGLNQQLHEQHQAVVQQTQVVNYWKKALADANRELDQQQAKLDRQQKYLDNLQGRYDKASQSLSDFANAPIKGMQKYSDEIFRNGEAQKKLQLRIDKWQQSHQDIDTLRNKYADLRGEIEALQGEEARLRSKGAGSDVLGPIDAQIAALQKQSDAINTTVSNSPVDKLQAQMDKLNKAGEILQLQNDIKFDPLEHQIQKLADTSKELTYDQIVNGITKAKDTMAKLDPEIKKQTAIVKAQQKVVNDATRNRDALNRQYNHEQHILEGLTRQYDKTEKAIQRVTDALHSVGSAAADAASKQAAAAKKAAGTKLSATQADFAAAAKGNFANVGGNSLVGREGGKGNQTGDINAWVKRQQELLKKRLGKMDMFGPLKKAWSKAWKWIKDNISPIVNDVGNMIGAAFKGVGDLISGAFQAISNSGAGGGVSKIFKVITSAVDGLVKLFKFFEPDLVRIGQALGDWFQLMWTKLGPAVVKFLKAVVPLGKFLGGVLILGLRAVSYVFSKVLGPVLTLVTDLVANVLSVFADFLNFIVNMFTGNFGQAMKDIGKFFSETFGGIMQLIKDVGRVLYNVVRVIVTGIVNFFKWLYDVLIGHSIIPDLVDGIIKFFNMLAAPIKAAFRLVWAGVKLMWNHVGKPIFHLIERLVKDWAHVFEWIWHKVIKPAWNVIWSIIKKVWNNFAKPIFRGIQLELKGWAKIFGWIWDHIIKPAWNAIWSIIKKVWNTVARPIFHGISIVLKDWAGIFKWIWDHVISPAWHGIIDGLKKAWNTYGKPFWDILKSVVHSLAGTFQTVKTKVVDAWNAIWNAIQTAWGAVKSSVLQPILDTFGHVVNGFIRAINFIIGGIDKVSGWLHLGISVDKIGTWDIPQLAKGGRIPQSEVGSGFKTNKPRAIVGEGGRHPEYVIPTDPKHRKRASWLWKAAGKDIAMFAAGGKLPGPPSYNTYNPNVGNISDATVNMDIAISNKEVTSMIEAQKGFMDKLGDSVTNILKSVVGFAVRNAVKAAFWPIKEAVDKILDAMPLEWLKEWGKALLDAVWHKIDSIARDQDKAAAKPYDWGFGEKVNRFDSIALESLMKLDKNILNDLVLIPHVLRRLNQESGGDPNAINNWDSNAKKGTPSKGIMQVIDPTFQAYKSASMPDNIWDPRANMFAGLNYAKDRYGSVQAAMDKSGGYRYGTKHARPGWHLAGEHGPELINFNKGASVFDNPKTIKEVASVIAKAERKARKDARYDGALAEATPTVNNTYNNKKEVHLHIDKLVFPNITAESDVEKFLNNFESLAEGSL